MQLQNPYPDAPPGQSNHKVSARVSPADFAFLRRLFPLAHGLTDRLVSTLYYELVTELRRIDSITPLEPAWELSHPSYDILISVLERCSPRQRPAGGSPGPRDGAGGTDGLHPTVQRPAQQRPDTEGVPLRREEAQDLEESFQRRLSDAVTAAVDAERMKTYSDMLSCCETIEEKRLVESIMVALETKRTLDL